LVTSGVELPSETGYWREGRGNYRSDRKTRKKTFRVLDVLNLLEPEFYI